MEVSSFWACSALLLDLGLQRVAEGLGPCAIEGEFRLVLLPLGFSHLDS